MFSMNWIVNVRGKWGKTDQRGKTDHRLSGPNQRCYMLEYIIATFVLVCPSRAGHMYGRASRHRFRVIRQNVVFPQNHLM